MQSKTRLRAIGNYEDSETLDNSFRNLTLSRLFRAGAKSTQVQYSDHATPDQMKPPMNAILGGDNA